MSLRSIFVLVVIVALTALFIGCAKPPQAEVDAAKAALEAAKAVEADRYVASAFKAAKDSLNAATAEIEVQNGKFALTRNYKKAAALLTAAVQLANDAKDKTAAKKEEVKAEATQLVTDLQTALADAKKLIKKAPRGKEGRAALEAMQEELKVVEASGAEVPAIIEKGDFLTARDTLKADLQKVNSIIDEVKQAMTKAGRK